MLGNQALPGRELFGDVAHWRFALRQQAQDSQPHRIGERFQEVAGLFRGVGKGGRVDRGQWTDIIGARGHFRG